MGELDARLALLRFSGDIHIKARATRHQFVRRLLHNLRDAIASTGAAPRVRLSHNRIFVELGDGLPVEVLARVAGIQSVSPVEAVCPAELSEVVATGLSRYRERVRGLRFAVRARRVGACEGLAFGPREVENDLGAALLPHSGGVDLGNPELTVHVELNEGRAYLFDARLPGPGGLPLGVEGLGAALLSGGFDSAVAAWLLLRRGVALDYVFCNLGGASHRLGALRVAALLAERWQYGQRPQLHAVEFEPLVANLRAHTEKRYWQVLLKRLMLRAGDRVAGAIGAPALVTGEAVGQVSSQTLQNLSVISRATERMVLRPLVGAHKEEIIARAREIGTFDLSRVVGEYCDLVPRRPATGAALDAIERQEERLDPELLAQAVAGRRVYDLRALREDDLDLPELAVERVPEGAILIDLREKPEYDSWHHPGALRLELARALAAYPSFERGRPYLLYCDLGLMSAHLAERMRKEGFDAYHFRGGTRALRRLSPER